MGYVAEMRALVGSRPLLLAAAGVLLLDADGRLLLERRADNGLWGIPGGAVELGERVEDAARREAYEETGLNVGALELFGVFSGPEMSYVYPNGDETSIVSVVFLSRDVTGVIRPNLPESLEARWFAPDTLPPMEQVSAPNRPILRRFGEWAHCRTDQKVPGGGVSL